MKNQHAAIITYDDVNVYVKIINTNFDIVYEFEFCRFDGNEENNFVECIDDEIDNEFEYKVIYA